MAGRRRIPCLLLLAALVLAAALAAGGCGASDNSKDVAEGEPVQLGDLSYNVIFSRYLNANDPEDMAYLVGQPQLGRTDLYLGIFLQLGGSIAPDDAVPVQYSTAQTGPIEGSLVIFKIPTTATESRPLTMSIPGQDGPAQIQLDL